MQSTTKISSARRMSKDDLEIEFKVGGESFAVFIGADKIKGKSKIDIVHALNDELSCAICCSQKASFALCMARCVEGDGKCCDGGATNCD